MNRKYAIGNMLFYSFFFCHNFETIVYDDGLILIFCKKICLKPVVLATETFLNKLIVD